MKNNFRHYILILTLLLLVALTGCTPVEPAQTAAPGVEAGPTVIEIPANQEAGQQRTEIIGGDEASLREFLRRWFTNIYIGAPQGESFVRIGSLPEDLPFEIPLPQGAVVVASVREPWGFDQIFLDVPLTGEEVSAFYAQALTEAGWRPPPTPPQGGGFVSGPAWDQYCLGENQGYMQIGTFEAAGQPTDVRLSLQVPNEPYPCQENAPDYSDPGMQQIPMLMSPTGVNTTSSSGGSSSDGSAYTSTDLVTSLSASELLAQYNTQLEATGWQMVDQSSTEVASWSAWRFTDEKEQEWGGTLIVMDSYLDSERRFALLSVEPIP